ncbi:symmetrical bis(5'-nucleosyl)-tetraphosphatase [Xanthomonas campestris pv. badrii]|uniref:Bis(5'-nucleosyl)-tetraphosphatase, symmetrical n=1 Tax=Xanthomonas campestris pv. badrii TaxID=149696 RepID=A0A7Z2ZFV1_XANCA|nr:symmetrical bis(5'-nucleosyl)-tetraphosphatase [Xanthomonas campestris]MCC4602733.1 symmetrical bis(5'-nucleosyl)-tetraphosphatase [Xanthomonas campestris pv. parthenii]QJD66749.1 symmetrical bis(5'-nucleosyl)-tetraphosphatase [Xanthomonas campestris pv. badrii]
MSVWAIGDLQGCYDITQRLLEKINFDPAQDTLWFCGDLVNRGGQSLETLRLVHSLRAHSVVVLGNHDLSLLAIGARSEEEQRKVNPDLQRIVLAEDRDVLLDWLRMQKLAHVDRTLGWMMIHAGLAPKWTTQMAEKHAREVEQQLQGGGYRKLLRNMYGDQPGWSPGLSGYERSRAIINLFTRMRYCTPRGRIATEDKGTPGTQAQGLYPWFEVPGRVERDLKIVCGHWSALGLTITQGVHAIDTGAVWGGKLTALQLDTDALRVVQVPGREVTAPATPAVHAPRRPREGQGRPRGRGRERGGNGGGGAGGGGSANGKGAAAPTDGEPGAAAAGPTGPAAE